jgi:Mg-chelatase subunit ChlD
MRIQRRQGERGIAIPATAVFLVIAIPMVGLAIDSTMLYIVKTRLQGACDGAALAAAKALSRGADGPTQTSAAADAAATYVRMNYPSTFFFSGDVAMDKTTDVTIDLSVTNQRTVSVTASVNEPTLFMRWLSFTSTTVRASAQTVRKDVNVVLVLDRSGSMTASGSCGPMKQAAINFVANFAPGRDNVSIISFATSVAVQMPLTQTFKAADGTGTGTDPKVAINGIQCQGSTNTASAVWNAYNQLAVLNQPAALNYIVLFTDGEPTAVDVNMPLNNPTSPHCTQNTYNVTAANSNTPPTGLHAPYTGRFMPGNVAVFTNDTGWLGVMVNTAIPNSNGTPPSSTLPNTNDQVLVSYDAGCDFAGNNGATTDFQGVPTHDMYNNDLLDGFENVLGSGGNYITISNGPGMGTEMASNAADSAGQRIRSGATITASTLPMLGTTTAAAGVGQHLNGVIIHSIGLGNASVPLAADNTFLSRMSNIPTSPTYNANYGSGKYVYVQQSSDLGNAFAQIASEILRLAR